jgi:hypothetical protein
MRSVTASEALACTAQSLGLAGDALIGAIIKSALRRAVFLLAPASHTDVIRFVAEPLSSLGVDRAMVDAALEDLITFGDALEMRKAASDPWDAPAVVLRPAPPSFVERDDGALVILGIAGDQPTALPPDLHGRIVDRGPVRILPAHKTEHLAAHLRLVGLAQLSEQAWLRLPAAEPADIHRRHWAEALEAIAASQGAVEDVEILDTARSVRYYRGRWRIPTPAMTGIFIARRPQLYGARLWSLAAIVDGVCRQVLDLYEDQERQRPCDLAWRIQAAIDADAGQPQEVRVRRNAAACQLDFFGPIPAFAERRLSLGGSKCAGQGCLFSFLLAPEQLENELLALQRYLWMRPVRDEEL